MSFEVSEKIWNIINYILLKSFNIDALHGNGKKYKLK